MLVSLAHQQQLRKKQRQERDARRGRLGSGRFNALAKELADMVRLAFEAGATGSLWGLEGPLRAGIRSDLCRMGWRWSDADGMARELLEDAFRRARAVRPSWNEGQPEWTIEAGTLIERTRCVRCGKPLPEGNHKFCDQLCSWSHHARLVFLRQATEDQVVKVITRNSVT